MRVPPFYLPTDPELKHRTGSDWFDGRLLASYFVATGQFVHVTLRIEPSTASLATLVCTTPDTYATPSPDTRFKPHRGSQCPADRSQGTSARRSTPIC